MRKHDGFTLIELMIVVTIIVIVAAVAIPNMVRSRMSANEASAAGAIRTISTSESCFQSACFFDNDADGRGDYGTLAQLANPDGAGLTPPFIDQVLGSGQRQGYVYAIAIVMGTAAANPAFACTATPQTSHLTGYRQYFVDETGVIRFTADGTPATAASRPLS
ncbi:MAG TPA: prepilin-type N-terminal cleavage/methylation domain-containing protein [Candidatus Hydrogenedentes bacterium]|nr:prepilin-type N-terminal cleavage/methylation domain-containing protein [Candidatus Hydrogenedentota bacterium]HOS04228.1 prepilin-type N-terminal cleavage/methylation domain-containing protein [Candidatus Hydrogenedentota bacterium]